MLRLTKQRFSIGVKILKHERTIFQQSLKTMKTRLNGNLDLDFGGKLEAVDIAWEQWGNKNNPNVIVVCPSLSVSSHARSTVEDPTAGWWESIIGAEKGIDTDQFRVICASNIGSPFGSTSSISINEKNNEKYGPNFPQITPNDIAKATWKLLDELNVDSLSAIVGASLGGCTALCMASQRPEKVKRLLAVSCTAKTSAGSTALRHVQRDAIRLDPLYKKGHYDEDSPPLAGLRLARQLGMITYRSLEEFSERFEHHAKAPIEFAEKLTFDVERYLRYKSEQFAGVYDANCFLTMSLCSDLMDLSRGQKNFAEGIGKICAKTLIIGVANDIIIPFEEQYKLYSVLKALGKDVELSKYYSIYGHDAFFVDDHFFLPKIRTFLSGALL